MTMRTPSANRPFILWLLVFSIAMAGAVTVGVADQASLSTEEQLLAEIRALRADINSALGANVRAQLFVGRLQLQEQRMNALGVQLAEARASLTEADKERSTLTARFESFQKSLQSGDVPFEQRKDVEAMLGGLKQEVARTEALRERLQAQAAELSGQLTTEQGRWVYFNDSLDQIEQSLQQLQQAR